MAMRKYDVTINGSTPLLMHWDNIEWADEMDAWKNDPDNSKSSKAGDDRSPAWRWMGSLYHDDNVVGVPSDNLMKCLMEGGAKVPMPGGRSNQTFKSATQSGMMVDQSDWPLLIDGKAIPMSSIRPLRASTNFSEHRDACVALGFRLFVKRAKVGQSKHIRVRPRFDHWALKGTISVWDDAITLRALQDIFRYAGTIKGLGDWRPSAPKSPGSFGMFTAEIKEL